MKLHWLCDPYRIHTHRVTGGRAHTIHFRLWQFSCCCTDMNFTLVELLWTGLHFITNKADSSKPSIIIFNGISLAFCSDLTASILWLNISLRVFSASYYSQLLIILCRGNGPNCVCPCSPVWQWQSKLHQSCGESGGCRINTWTNLTPAVRPDYLRAAALPLCGYQWVLQSCRGWHPSLGWTWGEREGNEENIPMHVTHQRPLISWPQTPDKAYSNTTS